MHFIIIKMSEDNPNYNRKNKSEKILFSILINMGEDKKITDEKYSKYFKEKNSILGVKQIIKKNKFIINGFPIPGTEELFSKNYPDGYLINKKKWLYYSKGKYHVNQSKNDFDTYEEASFITATGFLAGLEIRLYDLDNDKYIDYIELDYVEAVIINDIIKNNDNILSLYRADINDELKSDKDGRRFDGDCFSKKWEEKIDIKNFDPSIKKGDMCLFMYTPDGWIINRAKEIKGNLVDGEDHKYYKIGENKFQDAMRFSRDNIIISNRCGEYLNAHKYFGFLNKNNGEDNCDVSLWFIQTLDENKFGAPCGFTSGKSAKFFLQKAIELSKKKLSDISLENNAKKGQKYINQIEYDEFNNLILKAEKIIEEENINEIYDYFVYLLYLANFGSQSDIGAKFAGFNYVGFDNEIKLKN